MGIEAVNDIPTQLFIIFMPGWQIEHQLLANAVVHDVEIVFQ